ncbi:lysylphosphatidylglycerol synthase transmembrane domain-containing protein [Candidatus Latescibacterota bacterium]
MKKHLITTLKFAVVGGIFIFLYRSGQLDVSKLTAAYDHLGLFFLSMAFIFSGSLLTVERWRCLLRVQNFHIGYWLGAKLTLVGLYFSAVIPGSVSGDIVKAYYIAHGEDDKESLVTSVLFDRLLGLFTTILYASLALGTGVVIALVTGEGGVWTEPALVSLSLFVLALFFGLTLMGLLFMSSNLRRSSLIENTLKRLPLSRLLTKVYDAVHEYGRNPALTARAFALSIVSQIPLFAGLWCMALILGISELSVLDFLVALPVCFLINAIPLAPGGLGVGEAGFGTVFLMFGSESGAELSMLFHAVFFMLALGLGGGVYLLTDVSKESWTRP